MVPLNKKNRIEEINILRSTTSRSEDWRSGRDVSTVCVTVLFTPGSCLCRDYRKVD